jgi:hypothetical protein
MDWPLIVLVYGSVVSESISRIWNITARDTRDKGIPKSKIGVLLYPGDAQETKFI